jgi:hypothetical protein
MTCPACKSEEVFASRPRKFEEAFYCNVFPLRYYRCHACRWRSARVVFEMKPLLTSLGTLTFAFLLGYTMLVFMKVIH